LLANLSRNLRETPFPARAESVLALSEVQKAIVETRFVERSTRSFLDRSLRESLGRQFAVWVGGRRIWLLRVSIGLTYLWFGSLKFSAGMSPAEALATTTMSALTHGLVPAFASLRMLAIWECAVGLCFITGRWFRLGLRLLYAHMAGTTTALFLWPSQLFTHIPYQPTLEGQYIIKNLVFIAAAAVLGGAVSEEPL
jgi:uncharacterized membrane protein YkgB